MRATVVALHVMVLALGALVGLATDARAQDVIRIGCPTKTYFPTILATVAKDRGLFEKEGLRPEITIYRGGAETFEAIAAGSADLGTVAVPLVDVSEKLVASSVKASEVRRLVRAESNTTPLTKVKL